MKKIMNEIGEIWQELGKKYRRLDLIQKIIAIAIMLFVLKYVFDHGKKFNDGD